MNVLLAHKTRIANVKIVMGANIDVFITLDEDMNCVISLLVGCFGLNGPLRQYFSLYRAVSQREGERGEKG